MKIIWDERGDISAIDLRRKLKERYGKDYSRTTLASLTDFKMLSFYILAIAFRFNSLLRSISLSASLPELL